MHKQLAAYLKISTTKITYFSKRKDKINNLEVESCQRACSDYAFPNYAKDSHTMVNSPRFWTLEVCRNLSRSKF
jgi:hypothetical protein